MKKKFTFLIMAMMFAILGPGAEAWGQAGNKYVKVTSAPTDWSGEYLLVYESSATAGVAWTGIDAASCNVAVTISSEEIAEKPDNAVTITIATMTGGYSIKVNGGTNNGKYIKGTSGSNALGFDNNAQLNTISYDATNKGVLITSNTSVMRYNSDKNNYRFRYFKSSSYSGQKIVQLYKKEAGTPSTTPTCTIDPTSHDFGEITVGNNNTFDFTVTTANLTENLTLAVSEGFSVSPTTIESTETETTVTVTCTPTAVGTFDGTLTISGGGLTDDVTATLSATGLCTAPENELAYETPIALTLTGTEVETTLTPIENTGNGGTITYELIEGDDTHAIVDGNTFMADAIGSYTVRATQAVNGIICGGTFNIEINVTSTSPSCSVSPSEWNFGNVAIGTSASKTFTVTTANLTDDLTVGLSMGETTYSVTPTTIPQSATSTDVTVTFTPVEDGLVEELLTISGGGLTSDVEVVLSATGISPYTVTYVAVNGDAPQAAIVEPGSSITLGTVENVDCNTWQFAGWSESETSTEAPTLLAGNEYTPTENVTLYAVYKKAEASEPTQVPFVFADIAEANNWQNSQAYTSVVIDPVTITANGGGNNGKYYTSDQTWRMYNGGSVTITSTGNNITAVSSNPSKQFTINDGIASLNITTTTNFKSITVTCTPPTSFSYSTTPSCLEIVATPTITPNGGEFIGSQEITLACTTEGAIITYTTDDWATSSTYSAPFTITETTTIKVKATKDGMSESEEVSATFTKVPVLETIQEIFDASATAGNYYVKLNNWVVSGVKGSNAYVTDGTKGFIVYKSSHGFAVGNILSGTAQLALTRYNGAAEFTSLTATTQGISVTEGGTVTPVEMNIADLSGVNTGAVIKVNNVQYNGTNLVDENSNIIKPYNAVDYNPTFTNGLKYNVTGVYIQFNTTKEIAPRSADDIEEIVPTEPSITVAETLNLPYTESEVETLEVSYENVDFEMLDLYFYDDAGCTIESENDWFIADFTEDGSHNIEYSASENTESTPRTVYMQIYYLYNDGESELTKVITVTQEAAPQTYNVTLSSNGVVNEPQPVQGSITLSDPTNIPTGFTFAGWTESESEIQFVANPYTPTSNVTLYAVFSRVEGGSGETTWNLVTNSSEIVAGKVIKIAATVSGASVEANNGTFAANGTISSSIMGKVSATISDNKLTNDEGAAEFTIGGTSGNWTLTYGGNLLGATDVKKLTYDGGTTTWSISIGEDTKASIANGTNSYGTILYNRDSPRFTTYTSTPTASMVLPQIFVKTVSGTTHYYTRVFLNETAEANITISGPSIIPVNSTLNMGEYELTNETAANLIIEDGAQLILNEKNIGVMATVKKQIEASNTHTSEPVDKWYTIGSPVKEPIINGSTGNYVADIIPAGGMSALTYDLYYLDMTAGTWINYRQEGDTPGFTTLENGRGYIYSNQSATTVKYVGELNTANVNRSVNTGWNLVSNPFAQTIAFRNFELDNSASMVGYYSLDGAGGWQAEPITTVVASNTGILVNVPEGASSIEISKPAEAIENNGAKRGDSNDNAYAYIEINVANANYSDRAYAAFAEGYGLPKYDHINAEIQKVYIPQDGEDFAIAMMDENVTLFPLNFKAMTTGYYTISLKSSQIYEGYNDFDYLHLIDNMTGEEIDMLLEDGYKFAASPKDNAGRFTVKLHRNGVEENDIEDANFVYQNGNELVINGEGTFQLIDMLGRVVISKEVHGETVNVGSLNTGAYIVRMIGNEVKTQKIVIK